MKKLLLLSIISLCLGCKREEGPVDTAARAAGKYLVEYYVVDQDTLWSARGINKLGLSDFHIEVSRVSADSVLITHRSVRNGSSSGFGVYSRIQEVDGIFQLANKINSHYLHESTIAGGVFYERSVNMNADSLLKRWEYDSLKSPYEIPLREVILSARK
ncbi:hypothetical protein GCM10027275_14810 [Rhabdobacter roseus]|uniref:Uncharacterized protein n=1 Tax=Rhabdobacter roseus TaxID=1655419 RepID=A0A840TJ42_9BACT|nr:hypothetical protein [Rhabdobacter roseus]MBB5283401.1 hypothetical protein [Rhabdobacter roseus]